MRKIVKLVAVMTAMALMSLMFVGCSVDEINLLNAMLKAQSITSMETQTAITLNMDITGLPEDQQLLADIVMEQMNGATLDIYQKIKQNKDRTVSRSQVDLNLDMGSLTTSMSMWNDINLNAKKPYIKQILRLPNLVTMSLPEELRGKQYMVNDMLDMQSMPVTNEFDMKKLMSVSADMQKKLMDFILEYAKEFNPGFEVVRKTGTKSIDGKECTVYQLKMDDKAFKAFLQSAVTDLLKNQKTPELIKDLILALDGVVSESPALESEELDTAMEELKAMLPEISESFTQFMDVFKDVKIIGDEGIVLDYAVNPDGYIVSESGTIDLEIDLEAVVKALETLTGQPLPEDAEGLTGVLHMSIDIDHKIFNINKNKAVTLPKVTKANSFNMSELLMSEDLQFPMDELDSLPF